MGRPIKQGLEYFPLDTEWDIKMQLVKARFGLEGIGCIIELYKLIYHEGYTLRWDEDTRLLFSANNRITEPTLSEIVEFAVGKGIFSSEKLEKYGVLTSRGIQKRWLQVVKGTSRSIKETDPEYDLTGTAGLSGKESATVQDNDALPRRGTTQEAGLSGKESAQSKVKESKEKKRSAPPTESVDFREAVQPEEASAGFILDDDPEPDPESVPVDIPERYVDAVYDAWVELGDKVYQPSSLWQFQQVWGRDVAPYVKGIHSTDVLAAIGNFRTIVTAPKGTYFWSMRIGTGQFFSRHLDRFLPKNFKAEDFLPRLSYKDQEAAETAAAMAEVFGKKGVEA